MATLSLIKSQVSYRGTLKALQPFKEELRLRIKDLPEIVVKINFVSSLIELATTPLNTVKAFVDFVKPFYNGKIVITEEASLGSTGTGFRSFGFTQTFADDPQIKLFDSAKSPSKKVEIKYSGGNISLPLAQIYTRSPFIVSICRAKTHDAVVTTLSIKNLLVGAIQQRFWGNRGKIHQGRDIHQILTGIADHVFPHFAIIDGVVGMEGNGPVHGTPIKSGWIIAGNDPLAADSLASNLMGFNIKNIGYLSLLAESDSAGKGVLFSDPKIKIIGEKPASLIKPYRPHQTFEQQKKWK